MKGNCGECLSRWYCDINPDECDAWPDPVPMTNADHIRSMTDEELAELMYEVDKREGYAYLETWIERLKQPAEEDT